MNNGNEIAFITSRFEYLYRIEAENYKLEQQVEELKEELLLESNKATARGLFIASEMDANIAKCDAWDDLEALVKETKDTFHIIKMGMIGDKYGVIYKTFESKLFETSDLKVSVSNALKSLKEDS